MWSMVKRKGLEIGDSAWVSMSARSHRTPWLSCRSVNYFTIQAGALWLKGNRFYEGIACCGWSAIATCAMHVYLDIYEHEGGQLFRQVWTSLICFLLLSLRIVKETYSIFNSIIFDNWLIKIKVVLVIKFSQMFYFN